MTIELHFQGYSDDTFGEYNVFNDDHDNCASGEPIVWKVSDAEGNGMLVVGQYGVRSGCWSIGIEQLEEHVHLDKYVPLPKWPVEFDTADNGYSPLLIITVPESVTMKLVTK